MTIGLNVIQGLVTEAQMLKGKIAAPGNQQTVTIGGETKVFVSVKLGATVWQNGTLLILDGGGLNVAVTASGAPALDQNPRVGVLVFASATSTQTLSATGVGWAQIYGQVLARISASVTIPGEALGVGAGPGALLAQVGISASTMMHGITAIGTNTASVVAAGVALLSVFLNYPCFIGPPDTNLA